MVVHTTWYVCNAMLMRFVYYSWLNFYFSYVVDDKVTVLESEKRAWENSSEAQAMREALNPWRNHDAQERKSS